MIQGRHGLEGERTQPSVLKVFVKVMAESPFLPSYYFLEIEREKKPRLEYVFIFTQKTHL